MIYKKEKTSMKRLLAIVFSLALLYSVCNYSAFAESSKPDIPAFEKTGLSRRTLNLSEHSGETFTYITSGSSQNPTSTVSCELTAQWVTVFDPEVGYSEDMSSFYVPEGVFAENVQFTGSAPLFKNMEGYEWRCGRFVSSSSTGIFMINTYEDYYTLQQYDEEGDIDFLENDNGFITLGSFSVSYNEKEYNNCFLYVDWQQLSSDPIVITVNVFYRVPCGYDGCVLGVVDTRNFKMDKATGIYEMDPNQSIRGASDYYFRMK